MTSRPAGASPQGAAPSRSSAPQRGPKPAAKTSELSFYVVIGALVLLAAAVMGAEDGRLDPLRADRAWLYVTLLTVFYMVSRGLAKTAGRPGTPAAGKLLVTVGLLVLLIGGVLNGDLRQAPAQAQTTPAQEAPRPAPQAAAAPGGPALAGEQRRRVEAERRVTAARQRESAWRARARRVERALKQERTRARGSKRR